MMQGRELLNIDDKSNNINIVTGTGNDCLICDLKILCGDEVTLKCTNNCENYFHIDCWTEMGHNDLLKNYTFERSDLDNGCVLTIKNIGCDQGKTRKITSTLMTNRNNKSEDNTDLTLSKETTNDRSKKKRSRVIISPPFKGSTLKKSGSAQCKTCLVFETNIINYPCNHITYCYGCIQSQKKCWQCLETLLGYSFLYQK